MLDDIQGHIADKTNLIQLVTSNPEEGPRLISARHNVGVPIVVLVDKPCCCYVKLDVPDGIVTLEENLGEFTGILSPGCNCCYTNHKRIAAMITTNTVRFNAPVRI
jgi:hypothetical protein